MIAKDKNNKWLQRTKITNDCKGQNNKWLQKTKITNDCKGQK